MHENADTNFINSTEGLSEHRSSRNELTPLYSSNPDNGTLKIIILVSAIFSIAVTFSLALQVYYGNPQVARYGTVSSFSEICSTEGVTIIKKGGNAVDASITTAFCLSVMYPHVTGIGGGGLMLIYNHKERKVLDCIDFRVSRSTDKRIGVPGFVAGLFLAHQLYGILPWKMLLEPAVNLAKNGFPVSADLIESLPIVSNADYNERLRNWSSSLKEGEIITMTNLASLLSAISNSTDAPDDKVLKLSDYLNKSDVDNYVVISSSVVRKIYNNYEIMTSGGRSGGPLLFKMLTNISSNGTEHGITDESSAPPVSSSTVIALDLNDLYVSLVSGLGSLFGSQVLTKSGYILNNFLDLSDDKANRPSVSMAPVIAVQKKHICGVRYISGGSDIPQLSYVVHKLLNNDTSTDDKINSGDVNNSNPLSSALIASPFRTVIINVVKKFIDQVTVYPNILETL